MFKPIKRNSKKQIITYANGAGLEVWLQLYGEIFVLVHAPSQMPIVEVRRFPFPRGAKDRITPLKDLFAWAEEIAKLTDWTKPAEILQRLPNVVELYHACRAIPEHLKRKQPEFPASYCSVKFV